MADAGAGGGRADAPGTKAEEDAPMTAASDPSSKVDEDTSMAGAPGVKFGQTTAGKLATAQDIKDKAGEHFRTGNLRAAARQYKKALLYTTGIPGLNGGMDEYAVMMGRHIPSPDPQELHLEPAINAFNVTVWVNLAVVYSKLGQYERGLGYARKALAVDEKHAKASYYVGRLLAQAGRLEEALNHLKPVELFLQGVEEHASVLKAVQTEIRRTNKKLARQQQLADRTMAAAMRRSLGSG